MTRHPEYAQLAIDLAAAADDPDPRAVLRVLQGAVVWVPEERQREMLRWLARMAAEGWPSARRYASTEGKVGGS